jgi:hypothetical protein
MTRIVKVNRFGFIFLLPNNNFIMESSSQSEKRLGLAQRVNLIDDIKMTSSRSYRRVLFLVIIPELAADVKAFCRLLWPFYK